MAYPDPRVFSPAGIIAGTRVKCTVYPGNTRRNLSNALPGSNTRGYYISGYLRVTGTCWRVPGERNTHVMPYSGSHNKQSVEHLLKDLRCNTGMTFQYRHMNSTRLSQETIQAHVTMFIR